MKEIKDDKQMERHTVFLDWKNQYRQIGYATQRNLQIQYNPYHNSNSIFQRNGTNNPQICMEPQKPPNK